MVRFWTAIDKKYQYKGYKHREIQQSRIRSDVHAKSSVTPKGVPSSSLRAYRLPIDVFESSTREKTPALRNLEAAAEDRGK